MTLEAALVAPIVVTGKAIDADDRVTAGTAPAPVRDTVCGDPVALSATLSVPVTVPAAVGVKLTEIEQLPLAASVVPQVVAWEKALPERLIAIPVRVAVPGFESVTVFAPAAVFSGAVKLSVVGESTACAIGIGAAPVPLRVIVCVDPTAPPVLSVTVRFAV
jgi:hypothetical protein